MNNTPIIATLFLFAGCCSNIVILELIIGGDPGSGNLITFSQFLFVALEGFIFTSKFGTKTPVINLRTYLKLVSMFFIASVSSNYAFNFNVPVPLHIIFRSGSLVSNLILGSFILKRRYTLAKYVSVFLVTGGIILCTLETSKYKKDKQEIEETVGDKNMLGVGIALLFFSLLVSARVGIYQEEMFTKYGKHPREALFYTHALSMPGFVVLVPNIYNHFIQSLDSKYVEVVPGFGMPIMIIYLILNMVTQRACVGSVYVLTTECSSLTVTLLVTLRKFASLVFSVLYFRNPFTVVHWFGTFLVFIGTLLFTFAPQITNRTMNYASEKRCINNNIEKT